MPVLTASAADRPQLIRAFANPSRLVVVSLCAAWCDTCDAFRAAYERLATARPAIAFVWLDIEDDAALCGDVDVENFPTLAIYRGREPGHFGVSLPHEAVVGRMIDTLAASAAPLAAAPAAITELPDAFG
jgi:thioredoxin reductase (NADPH)